MLILLEGPIILAIMMISAVSVWFKSLGSNSKPNICVVGAPASGWMSRGAYFLSFGAAVFLDSCMCVQAHYRKCGNGQLGILILERIQNTLLFIAWSVSSYLHFHLQSYNQLNVKRPVTANWTSCGQRCDLSLELYIPQFVKSSIPILAIIPLWISGSIAFYFHTCLINI